MKRKKTTAVFVPKKFLLPPLFGLFVLSRAAEAQQEVLQPQMPPIEPITELNMTNAFQVFPVHPQATAPAPYEPFQWDQFTVRPHVDYQFIDAEGVLAAPGEPVNTTIQMISPGVLFNLGPHWALDYTATLGLYSNPDFGREFDNSITLTGQTTYTDWVFGFLQSAVLSSSPLIEFGGQVEQQYYTTTVTGHHEDSQYISEDVSLSQYIQSFSGSGYEDTRTWSTVDWLNYSPQPRFSLGIGPGLGYNNAAFGPASFFEQAQARVNWRATDKLSFQASGGVIETEFLGGQGNGDLFSPIYSGTIQYQPFAQTQISISGNRAVSPSAFVGEYYETTSVGASFSQRLLGQFYASLSASYNDQEYVASQIGVLASRTDKYSTVSARLSHSFLERGTISIFYQYSTDRSSVVGYSFNSNQLGAEASYSF